MRNRFEDFNEEEWRRYLKKIFESCKYKIKEIEQKLDILIKDLDLVELLSRVSFFSLFTFSHHFATKKMQELIPQLREKPILPFLTGLCLKKSYHPNRLPNNQEVQEIVELLNNYFDCFPLAYTFQSIEKEFNSKDEGTLILLARLHKIISQINPNIYKFQLEDLLKNIFGKLDSYFVRTVGFSIIDALNFGNRIIERYEKLSIECFKKVVEQLQRKRSIIENEDFHFGSLAQKIFVFEADEFCKEEKIEETEKFKMYLKVLSCKFGEVNKDFNTPLDENIITKKPIINIDDHRYFAPIPPYLLFNLTFIFESFLEKEKQTKNWQRYQKIKSRYTEDRTYEYFSRLFPKENMFRNLKYIFKGEEFEVDLLILFDNKIFIVESKAGALTEPAKRGALKRLKTDLKKLIEDAYQQAKRTRDYIKSTTHIIFKDKSGKKIVLNNKIGISNVEFFLINVTLEPLMNFSLNLKHLRSLGLFGQDEFPWSVYLFDLDIITRHIFSPTFLIHYLEKRLLVQDEDIFITFDELSFLGWYLERGNFYTPVIDENKKPDHVVLTVDWLAMFDDYYLYSKDAPKLKIEEDFLKIIKDLESLRLDGYTNIASTLLDLDRQDRELILKKIKELTIKTKQSKRNHYFSIIFKRIPDTGFTLMTQYGQEELRKRLYTYCAEKKKQTKTKRWIGLGKDVLDNERFVSEFVYLNLREKVNSK